MIVELSYRVSACFGFGVSGDTYLIQPIKYVSPELEELFLKKSLVFLYYVLKLTNK